VTTETVGDALPFGPDIVAFEYPPGAPAEADVRMLGYVTLVGMVVAVGLGSVVETGDEAGGLLLAEDDATPPGSVVKELVAPHSARELPSGQQPTLVQYLPLGQ
jgi:hypothetical protein